MAIKTFTTGEVLTAADTNTYLANSGLVYVSSTTVGSAVSSVTVSSCFNSTYDAYKIVATNVTASSSGILGFVLSGLTTGYYGNLMYANFTGGGVATVGFNNAASITHAGGTQGQILIFDMEVINPFLAKAKFISGRFMDNSAAGPYQVQNNSATSATGFTITPASGTLTGGQITVYGYRKA
jgi:hypothetical protein